MKNENKKIIAICYDFDKTLSPSDSSFDFGYFDKLNINNMDFWNEINAHETLKKVDSTSAYLYYTLQKAKDLNKELTYQDFLDYGKNAWFYNGVEQWFNRINKYAKKQGYKIEHYIISSGVKEVLSNTKIAKYFKKIYASSYIYDDNNHPIWPAYIVNYTNKTQYLYRIKKNILEESDERVNERLMGNNVHIPFENMIYIGDSLTDIPCMSIIYKRGGTSIGVYDEIPSHKDLVLKLYRNKRINYYAFADYSENSELDNIVKNAIDTIIKRDNI
ncbi:MAG: haloacid dehalogenase-like hydrolase [Clostridiales bacterium]|nr:haloacid dehalogenase-like hydrolase [Clostridiales bacterium]